jgi:hypothetical protein
MTFATPQIQCQSPTNSVLVISEAVRSPLGHSSHVTAY